jgi:hypothetical protein
VIPNISKEQTAFIVKGQGVLQTFYERILEDMGGMFLQNISITNQKPSTLNINNVENSYLALLVPTKLQTSSIPASMKHIQECDTPAQ